MFDYLFISLNRPTAGCILALPAPPNTLLYSPPGAVRTYVAAPQQSSSQSPSSVETPRIAVFAILLHLFIYYFVRILLCVFHASVCVCVCV